MKKKKFHDSQILSRFSILSSLLMCAIRVVLNLDVKIKGIYIECKF